MTTAMLGGIKELTMGGLNVLEWTGLLFIVGGAVYGAMRLVRRLRSKESSAESGSGMAAEPQDLDCGDGRE